MLQLVILATSQVYLGVSIPNRDYLMLQLRMSNVIYADLGVSIPNRDYLMLQRKILAKAMILLVSIPNRDYLMLQPAIKRFVDFANSVSIPNRDYLMLQQLAVEALLYSVFKVQLRQPNLKYCFSPSVVKSNLRKKYSNLYVEGISRIAPSSKSEKSLKLRQSKQPSH
jgi:phage gpG-like protein